MRRWYNTWMTVNLRPDARFEVTLAPIKHLTTDLRTMTRPAPLAVRFITWCAEWYRTIVLIIKGP